MDLALLRIATECLQPIRLNQQMGAQVAIRTPEADQVSDWRNATDGILLEASARHEQRAFAELVSRYHRDVFRVVWRLSNGHAEVDDVTQEAFMRLWANPGQIREAKALKGWLMRVASNLVMDRFRRKPMEELEAADEVADSALGAEAQVDRAQVAREIDTAIASLPERQKLALTLVHFEQMTNIAAAAAMEISVDALESLLARARRGLKEKLGERGKLLLAAMETENE
jgi:RNA polymerase sigma-70 factor (ECF subfamily)